MRIVAILQCRTNSTRLPGKAWLPLGGKPMVQNIVERVKRATRVHDVVLAVPGRLEEFNAFNHGWCEVFSPPVEEHDLVGRYLRVAERIGAEIIVRVPCDNPCIDPAYIDEAVDMYLRVPTLYYSNATAWCDRAIVDGIGAEVVSRSRLRWLYQRTTGRDDWREHPHKFFEEQGVLVQKKADWRVDVNTQSDYNFVSGIYNHFTHNQFTAQEVVSYLTKEDLCQKE